MRLSELPDHVKRLLLATCDDDVDQDEREQFTPDEFLYVMAKGCALGRVLAHLWMPASAGVPHNLFFGDNPYIGVDLEQDEPLPAITRDRRIASDPTLCMCYGWKEAYLRFTPVQHTADELLRARYEDLFQRELRLGWQVPEYDAWAETQTA